MSPLGEGARCFTFLFNRAGVDDLEGHIGKPIGSIWGRRLVILAPGDIVYLVGVRHGKLLLLARFVVAKVDADAGIAFGESTLIETDRIVSPAATVRLRFISRETTHAPVMQRGRLDAQTMRGIRRLTPDSAALLEASLSRTSDVQTSAWSDEIAMRALSVRQPWAELILRGIKTIEVRSRPTNVRERVYLYASPIRADLAIEREIKKRHAIESLGLERGHLVGTVEVVDCLPLTTADSPQACFQLTRTAGYFGWRLAKPERCDPPLRPIHRAQPVWFYPF